MMARSLLLFGGSFNPIHHGHLIVARAVAESLAVDRILLIPSANPPHKPADHLAPAADRLEMCRLAVRENPQFDVSDWEIDQPGPNFTLYTVRHFRAAAPEAELYWLIGMDSLRELTTWRRVGELAEECTLVTAVRPGYARPDLANLRGFMDEAAVSRIERHTLGTPAIDISASDIRARVAAGRSIRYLVPEAVEAYIHGRGLYAGT